MSSIGGSVAGGGRGGYVNGETVGEAAATGGAGPGTTLEQRATEQNRKALLADLETWFNGAPVGRFDRAAAAKMIAEAPVIGEGQRWALASLMSPPNDFRTEEAFAAVLARPELSNEKAHALQFVGQFGLHRDGYAYDQALFKKTFAKILDASAMSSHQAVAIGHLLETAGGDHKLASGNLIDEVLRRPGLTIGQERALGTIAKHARTGGGIDYNRAIRKILAARDVSEAQQNVLYRIAKATEPKEPLAMKGDAAIDAILAHPDLTDAQERTLDAILTCAHNGARFDVDRALGAVLARPALDANQECVLSGASGSIFGYYDRSRPDTLRRNDALDAVLAHPDLSTHQASALRTLAHEAHRGGSGFDVDGAMKQVLASTSMTWPQTAAIAAIAGLVAPGHRFSADKAISAVLANPEITEAQANLLGEIGEQATPESAIDVGRTVAAVLGLSKL